MSPNVEVVDMDEKRGSVAIPPIPEIHSPAKFIKRKSTLRVSTSMDLALKKQKTSKNFHPNYVDKDIERRA